MQPRVWISVFASLAVFVAFACHPEPAASPGPSPGPSPAPAANASPAAHGRPTSVENIVAAERAGKIDHDTSLVYQLYAFHDPGALPPEFSGAQPRTFGSTPLIAEISSRRATMRPDLKAAVEPFFHRPTEPGSFWAPPAPAAKGAEKDATREHDRLAKSPYVPADAWNTVDTSDGHIRIWYQPNGSVSGMAAKATALAQSLVSADAWGKEKGAMGRVPCSDASIPGTLADGSYANGALSADDPGAGRLDVYLIVAGQSVLRHPNPRGDEVNGANTGLTVNQRWMEGCGWASFSLVDATSSTDDIPAVVAHEMFHDFQWAFIPIDTSHDSPWLSEATATWAENLVYPKKNTEWHFLNLANAVESTWPSDWQGKAPDGPLTDFTPIDKGYAAYIFPFYMTQVANLAPSIMGTIWQDVPTESDSATSDRGLAALTKALGGTDGFRKAFKQFALANWNADVEDAELYQDYDESGAMNPMSHDAIFQRPPSPATIIKKPDPGTETPFSFEITNLAPTEVKYIEFDVDDAPYVPHVWFDLSGLAQYPDVSVQAILRRAADVGVSAKYRDWTGAQQEDLCRDKADEKVVSVILIVANAATDLSKTVSAKISGRSENACAPAKGNFTYSATTTSQHGQAPWCVSQRTNMDKATSQGGNLWQQTVTGTITYSEQATSQWKLTPVEDITNPMTKVRTIIYEIDSGNTISLNGSGSFEDQLHTRAVAPDGTVLGEMTKDSRTNFSNQASGTSCDGPAPKASGGQAASWSCPPGWTPPAGRGWGRNGQPGSLRLRFPATGPATYEIACGTNVVPMRSTCDKESSGTSSDGSNSSSSFRYNQGPKNTKGTIVSTSNPGGTSTREVPPPDAYSANDIDPKAKFWKGTFSGTQGSGGDIDASSTLSSSDCTGGYIGMDSAPCDYTNGDGTCEVCSSTATAHLHVHVDVPQAPLPSTPPPVTAAGTDPCSALAACCPSLAALPMGQSLMAPCTMLSGMKNPSGCSNMLDTLKKTNLCP